MASTNNSSHVAAFQEYSPKSKPKQLYLVVLINRIIGKIPSSTLTEIARNNFGAWYAYSFCRRDPDKLDIFEVGDNW